MKQMFSANIYNESYDILKDITNNIDKLLGLGPVDAPHPHAGVREVEDLEAGLHEGHY